MATDTVSARLRLLDLQIVDSDGLPIGRVDDVELHSGNTARQGPAGGRRDGVRVVALACGQGALGRRLGGTLGRLLEVSAARLGASGSNDEGQVTRISADLVQEVSSVLTLACPLADLPEVAGLERWLAAHLIARIPGAGEPVARATEEAAGAVNGSMLLSRVLGASVQDPSGKALGIVHDVRFQRGETRHEAALGQVTGLVVGPDRRRSRLAQAWGYAEQPRSGPAALRVLLGNEASRARMIPVDAILSWGCPLVVNGPVNRYPTLTAQERS